MITLSGRTIVIALFAWFLLAAAVTVTYATGRHTDQVVTFLEQRAESADAAAQAAKAQTAAQAKAFQDFFELFVPEQNYLCSAAVDHNRTLGGPPAPPGICSVPVP